MRKTPALESEWSEPGRLVPVTGNEGRIWTSAPVHACTLADSDQINCRILSAFLALDDDGFSRRTHFFGGRFENLYLDAGRIPELQIVLSQAEICAREILEWGSRPLHRGFWLNAQGPGHSTSEHTHEELDELLSGVYYISVPKNSGDILFRDGRLSMRLAPEPGLFLFFAPSLAHRVEANCSEGLRLSLAFNFGSDLALDD